MIKIEDLLFREWECFEQFASQREENRISVPVTLGQSGSIHSTEMVEAETSILFLMSLTFRTLAGREPHFICYQLATRRSSQIMEMIEAENLDLVANGRNYCTARKCRRKHFQRYLWF